MTSMTALAIAVVVAGCGSSNTTSTGAASSGPARDELSAVKRRGELVVATNAGYPPASALSPGGKWQGFDIDVATGIAKALGVRVKFVTPSWTVMTSGHWSGRWDLEIGSMDPTPERQRVLSFVDPPYYYLPASVAVAANAPYTSVGQLNGKSIGVLSGSTYQQYAEGKLAVAHVPYDGRGRRIQSVFTSGHHKGYATDTAALKDLSLGDGTRLNAYIGGPTVIEGARSRGLKVKILGRPVFYEPLAIGADRSANSASLVNAISRIVAGWHQDGTLSRLALKWFHQDYSKPAA